MVVAKEWLLRHRDGLMGAVIILLLVALVLESFLLYEQRSAVRAASTQSARLLTTFLEADTAKAGGTSGVAIRMQNVQFKWSDKVYVDMGDMALRAVPVEGSTVNFDDLSSFHLALQ